MSDDSWGDEDVPGLDLEFDDDGFGTAVFVSNLDLCRQRAREEFLANIGQAQAPQDEGDTGDEPWMSDSPMWPTPPGQEPGPSRAYYLNPDMEMDFEEELGGAKECKVPITWGKKNLNESDTEREARDTQNDYLVEDQYYPGLIDDAVHKKIDFYQTAFDLSFGEDELPMESPENPPISLVEAFELRVTKEQGARKKIMKEAPVVRSKPVPQTEKSKTSFIGFLKDEAATRRVNRDEVVLANVVDVELAAIVRNKPLNELTKAINCLQKAEIMNEYDKSLQAAEEAYQKAPPELAESAAVQKATTFITEELSKKKATIGSGRSYRPIEIISYVGITKPIIEEPELTATRPKF